ncbi:hypothetical protein DSO57_1033623 [Entomophthora muscae]|uniref:Uncharacterized protein n=1 Tax=Entomophthora muscae TaxID=34485 RepID=A0ACC2T039_9FUNG|nr:hypothetical protein DSO57_1033623 [Entomophthora muscae]
MMDPITFLGQPNATSSLGTKPTTLYAEPKPGQHEGAQFMYEKNTDKIVATATVFLNSPTLREKASNRLCSHPTRMLLLLAQRHPTGLRHPQPNIWPVLPLLRSLHLQHTLRLICL